jgi:hypothetical protein
MNVTYLRTSEATSVDYKRQGAAMLSLAPWQPAPVAERRRVAILLSTYNGENFLAAQLHSYLSQTHDDWTLHWRDDGSSDASVGVIGQFAAGAGQGRCVCHTQGGCGQVTRSFLALLRAARRSDATYFAFSDQDDVWLPEKLAHGVAALDNVPDAEPALYSSGRVLVDADLRGHCAPGRLRRPPGFPTALTQNVVPGCCMMLNRAAADLVLASQPPDTTWYDWWCYIIVAAAGGHLLIDHATTVLYRQHANNLVGETRSWWRRGIAALRRGPGPFVSLLRQHVATLQARPELLHESTHQQLAVIADALNGGRIARLKTFFLPGFARQNRLETLVFRVWLLLG